MANTPDFSKILSLIMENPELISQISALARSNTESEAAATIEEPVADSAEIQAGIEIPEEPQSRRRVNRAQLLNAMKPYLKESRSKAIDTMIGIADILDVMSGR